MKKNTGVKVSNYNSLFAYNLRLYLLFFSEYLKDSNFLITFFSP